MSFLLDPLSHAFMVRALLVSALVGGVCGLLSCYMTLKGWALMGDAVSHAVLPGVVVAYALGLPFSLGAFVFGVGSVAAIGFVKQKSRVKEDTVFGPVDYLVRPWLDGLMPASPLEHRDALADGAVRALLGG